MRGALVALLLATGTLAGCLTDDTDPLLEDSSEDARPEMELVLPEGESARAFIAEFIMTHPYRLNSPATQDFMDTARADLSAVLESFNLTVAHHDYGSGINILGIQNGTTDPEQWVVLSAHYDTTESTIYGAWDDGAGTALLMELARTLSQTDFPFTIVYAFFDEEEQGLVGSENFVSEYFQDGEHDLVANLNMDPPGLNWPCGDAQGPFPVKIIHNEEKLSNPRYALLHEAVEAGLASAEVPDAVRDYDPGIPIATVNGIGLRGTSDHASFDAVDVANVFLGGTPTSRAGPAAALTYGLHTPVDTLQQMEARCTEGSLAGGLEVIGVVVAEALAHFAKSGVPTT